MLLAVALVWGSSYGVTKLALAWYPVLGFLAVRFGLTFALLLPHLWRLDRATRIATLHAGLPLGLVLWMIFLSETYGVALTSAANAAFLISLCVVLTPFAEWLLLGRRPTSRALGFAVLSAVGAAMLVGNMQMTFGDGDALMLLAASLRAVAVCLTKRVSGPKAVDTLGLTAIQAGVVSLACLLLATAIGPEHLPQLPSNPGFWLACAYLVIFCTLFAFHDDTLDRVTGQSGSIGELSTSQLQEIQIDGQHPIPQLDDLLGAFPESRVNIDLKDDRAVEPLVKLIARHNADDRVCVGSFSHKRLIRFRRATSGRIATSASPQEVAAFLTLPSRILKRAQVSRRFQALQVPVKQGAIPVVNRSLIRRAHRLGVHVHVWTVDDRDEMQHLLALGVDGLITDRTDVLKNVLSHKGLWKGNP